MFGGTDIGFPFPHLSTCASKGCLVIRQSQWLYSITGYMMLLVIGKKIIIPWDWEAGHIFKHLMHLTSTFSLSLAKLLERQNQDCNNRQMTVSGPTIKRFRSRANSSWKFFSVLLNSRVSQRETLLDNFKSGLVEIFYYYYSNAILSFHPHVDCMVQVVFSLFTEWRIQEQMKSVACPASDRGHGTDLGLEYTKGTCFPWYCSAVVQWIL